MSKRHSQKIGYWSRSLPAFDVVILFALFGAMTYMLPKLLVSFTIGQQIGIGLSYVVVMAMIAGLLLYRGLSFETLGLKKVPRKHWIKILRRTMLVFFVATLAFFLGGGIAINLGLGIQHADLSGFNYLKGNAGLLILTLFAIYMTSSLGEEVIYRGFLIPRLIQIFGSGRWARGASILLSGIVFGVVHYAWGPAGIIQTTLMGWALGYFFVRFDFNLWVTILAHMCMDTLLVVQMY